jgi:hypothetical protein
MRKEYIKTVICVQLHEKKYKLRKELKRKEQIKIKEIERI